MGYTIEKKEPKAKTHSGRPSKYSDVYEAVKCSSGEWLCISPLSSTEAASIRNHYSQKLKIGAEYVEARIEWGENGVCALYLRQHQNGKQGG